MVVEFVFSELAAESVAVDAEHLGGAALVALCALKGTFDKTFFEFTDGFFK